MYKQKQNSRDEVSEMGHGLGLCFFAVCNAQQSQKLLYSLELYDNKGTVQDVLSSSFDVTLLLIRLKVRH